MGAKSLHRQPHCPTVTQVDEWLPSLLERVRRMCLVRLLPRKHSQLHAQPSLLCSAVCARAQYVHCFLMLMLALDHASVAGQQARGAVPTARRRRRAAVSCLAGCRVLRLCAMRARWRRRLALGAVFSIQHCFGRDRAHVLALKCLDLALSPRSTVHSRATSILSLRTAGRYGTRRHQSINTTHSGEESRITPNSTRDLA